MWDLPLMSVGAWAGMVVCIAMFVVGLVIGPRIWKNEWRWPTLHPDEVPAWWGYGPAMWRGWLRLAFVGYLEVSLFGIGGLFWSIDSETLHGFGSLAILIALVLLASMFPIVLFNRPKFLVLPWMRHQPGAIAEWRGADVPPTSPPGSGRTGVRAP